MAAQELRDTPGLWHSLQKQYVDVEFYTGGLSNPPKWHDVSEYPATGTGILEMLTTGAPCAGTPDANRGITLALNCTKLGYMAHSEYKHTGMHPPVLERILNDAYWPTLVTPFMSA